MFTYNMCSIDCNCVSNNPYKNNIDMKANAPERIWIDPANDLPKLSGHIDKDSVEYIRKDAFVEKAVEWINEHTSLSEKLVIENFVNYMKGE